jgi:outer membrane biogenesis lipoprotein LolB
MKTLLLISAALLLGGCAHKQKLDLKLYQPDQIILEAGKTIVTKEGSYTPQFDETFHSSKTVERLETIISNL